MATNTESGRTGPVVLLNEYKHVVLRRRVLQTLTGGAKIRKAPFYIHLIQFILWVFPLLVCVPVIILDALRIWNAYYLALVYGCVMGVAVMVLNVIIVYVRYRHSGTSVAKFGRHANVQLDDEESIDFESCLDFETFEFIFSQKKVHSLILHPFICGLVSFAGCFILLPSVMLEALHTAGVVIVSIIGWLTICGVQYSLNIASPHEVATYRPTDPLEIKFLTRPIYVVAIAAIVVPVRILVSQPAVYLQVLYSFLCLLPLGWSLGVLPQLDALLPWLLEGVLTRLMGGSHMATDLRLVVMFFLSLISVIIVSLTNHTLSVLLATAFGFLLSHDIFLNAKALLSIIIFPCKLGSSLRRNLFAKTFVSYSSIDFHSVNDYKSYLIHTVVFMFKGTVYLAISLVMVYFMFTLNNSEELVTSILAGCVIGLYVLLKMSDALQSVYIFNVFRNPLFPKQYENTSKFKKRRKWLRYFSLPKTLFISYLSPLLLLAYVSVGLETISTNIPHVWYGIAAARILRKVWQTTSSAHLDLAVVAILHFAVPTTNTWTSLGLATQSLIVGLVLEVTCDALQKLSFVFTMFITFLYDRKQRTYLSLNIVIIVGTILLLPLILVVVVISSALSAPLLPLFTLPIFVISFPRTRRFWPSLVDYGSIYSQCEDSVYYQQVEPEIVRVLHTAVGSITPGAFYLIRFEDRLAVAMVLERGFGYSVMSIRGLELQETSCHTVEATRIDDIFESMYGPSTKTCLEFWFNTHILNTLQPVDSTVMETYSDARNVLTGIIDQPSGLQRFSNNLTKTLVWVFYHHFMDLCSRVKDVTSTSNVSNSAIQHQQHHNTDSGFAESCSMLGQQSGDTFSKEFSNAWESTTYTRRPVATEDNEQPVKEEDAMSWSDSITSFDEVVPPLSRQTKPDMLPPFSNITPPAGYITEDIPGLIPEDRPLGVQHVYSETTIDNSNNVGDDNVQSDVRLSAIPLSGVGTSRNPNDHNRNFRKSSKVFPDTGSIIDECKIPPKWLDYPFSSTQIEKLERKLFSLEWLNFIKDRYDGELNPELQVQLMKVIVVCYSLVDVPCGGIQLRGRSDQTKPYDIFKGFNGEFQFSEHLQWLTRDSLLHSLVLKAYRYAVKLMYDEASLGEVEEYQELYEYLESYDREHYIGSENEPQWNEQILKQTPHLFSLGRDLEKNVYTAHVLSLQDQLVHIGQLNTAAVHGIWANLTFELFYLTNDDEERYSIQAHKTLLRNLTIQTADPPLGYSVYSSGLVRSPCQT